MKHHKSHYCYNQHRKVHAIIEFGTQNLTLSDAKKLNNRLSRMKKKLQRLTELHHYWKVRCKERGSYKKALQQLYERLERVKRLEAALLAFDQKKLVIHTKRKGRGREKVYALFLTHNDALRLKLWLGGRLPYGRKAKKFRGRV